MPVGENGVIKSRLGLYARSVVWQCDFPQFERWQYHNAKLSHNLMRYGVYDACGAVNTRLLVWRQFHIS